MEAHAAAHSVEARVCLLVATAALCTTHSCHCKQDAPFPFHFYSHLAESLCSHSKSDFNFFVWCSALAVPECTPLVSASGSAHTWTQTHMDAHGDRHTQMHTHAHGCTLGHTHTHGHKHTHGCARRHTHTLTHTNRHMDTHMYRAVEGTRPLLT